MFGAIIWIKLYYPKCLRNSNNTKETNDLIIFCEQILIQTCRCMKNAPLASGWENANQKQRTMGYMSVTGLLVRGENSRKAG